jgi:hypothetical protein
VPIVKNTRYRITSSAPIKEYALFTTDYLMLLQVYYLGT